MNKKYLKVKANMKLKELYINDYKLLKDFNILFEKNISIFIGINGSGKSTILEFISNTFYELYNHFVLINKEKPTLQFRLRYEIEYEARNYEIYITSRNSTKEYYEVVIKKENENSKKYSRAQIEKEFKNGYKNILPQNLVIYYSGISSILADRFTSFQKDYIRRSLNGEIKIEQPFFYFFEKNFPAILIALLSYQYGDIPSILESKFNIAGFQKIKIKLKKPYWGSKGGFWGAKGDLKYFLENLNKAIKTIDEKDNTFVILNRSDLENLWSPYGQEKSLFEYIVTLQANDLIDSIEIIINKGNTAISYSRLSEGEKQLLIIYGLKELLITENTLFLLDEPDTFLHPQWQVDFISSIFNYSASSKIKNQFLFTTHSPQLLANASNKITEVFLLNNTFPIKIPNFYGKEISAVLLELMGVKDRNNLASKEITELFDFIEDGKIEDAKGKLNSLKELLGPNEPVIIRAKIQIQFLEDELNEAHN